MKRREKAIRASTGDIRIMLARDLPPQVHIDAAVPQPSRFQAVRMNGRGLRRYMQPHGGFWTSARLEHNDSEYTAMLRRLFPGVAESCDGWLMTPRPDARLIEISSPADIDRLLSVARYRESCEIDFPRLAELGYDGVAFTVTPARVPDFFAWEIPSICWLKWSFTKAVKAWNAQPHMAVVRVEPISGALFRVWLPSPYAGLWLDFGQPTGEAAQLAEHAGEELHAERERGSHSLADHGVYRRRAAHTAFDATVKQHNLGGPAGIGLADALPDALREVALRAVHDGGFEAVRLRNLSPTPAVRVARSLLGGLIPIS